MVTARAYGLPMSNLSQEFRAEVEAFLAETGMKPSNFGRFAVNDTAFVSRLREGRDFKASMIDRIREYMRQYRTAA